MPIEGHGTRIYGICKVRMDGNEVRLTPLGGCVTVETELGGQEE
jgi:hypothetical protein